MRRLLLSVAWWCAAGLVAQAPIAVHAEAPSVEQCRVTATATPDALTVELRIAAGWHAYTKDVGGGMPVKVELDEGCDYVAGGPLRAPASDDGAVTGAARWVLPLTAKGDGGELRATVWYQVCDELECLRPQDVQLTARLDPFEVLLVVDAKGPRADRIEALLEARGMVVDVATYVDVTAAQCDAHEVVLADSLRFGEARGDRDLFSKSLKAAVAFPATEAPIVAVGFFGTELIEGQGVAMTSGYI